MSFDRDAVRNSERVYLTQDCIDALSFVCPRSDDRDKLIEEAVWILLSARFSGVVDCINERKEALRKFKAAQKDLTGIAGE